MNTLWQLLMKKRIRELKESIRMMNSLRNDIEKINLIEEGKKVGVNEVIKRNKMIITVKTVNIKWNLIV